MLYAFVNLSTVDSVIVNVIVIVIVTVMVIAVVTVPRVGRKERGLQTPAGERGAGTKGRRGKNPGRGNKKSCCTLRYSRIFYAKLNYWASTWPKVRPL